MESAIGEATGLFRIIRGTPLGEDNDFEITKSDRLVSMFIENLRFIRLIFSVTKLPRWREMHF
jgi:putative ABC transport system permease protein